MITSNPDAEKNPLVDYCLLYRHCREVHTHRILYAVLTDLLAYRYHEYLRSRKLLKENRIKKFAALCWKFPETERLFCYTAIISAQKSEK